MTNVTKRISCNVQILSSKPECLLQFRIYSHFEFRCLVSPAQLATGGGGGECQYLKGDNPKVAWAESGNTKGGSIIVPLTSSSTGLD